MKLPCGCYADERGKVFAKCAECNGSAVRSIQELKLLASQKRDADNERRLVRARQESPMRPCLRYGQVREHRQSEGGP